jgi:RNA polymerase sigma factor (sigma-70 family)
MKDEEVLERIRKGDETALQYLYKKHYRMILHLVTKNSGNEVEAQDIFQDALVLFWEKAQSPKFQLTAKITTFLYSICQNLWRKELSKKQRISFEEKDEAIIEDWEQNERIQAMHTCMSKLGETCKKILQLYYFDNLSMQDIAEKLGLANADTAKSKKYKCKKELDDLIKKHFKATDFLD